VAQAVWAKEMLAQECGRTIESLWDAVNAATNKLTIVADFPVQEVVLGCWPSSQRLPHGIERYEPAHRGPTFTRDSWRVYLDEVQRAGWQLVQTEFRHNRFDPDDRGRPRQSVFYFSAHLTNPRREARAIVAGDLVVDWQPAQKGGGAPTVARRPSLLHRPADSPGPGW
jgi:hypothetical protein